MMNNESLPHCIGFIMDGNRRFAREHDLETLEGHQKGHDVFKEAVRYVRDTGIPHSVFYAFSTENWARSEKEVHYLMELFRSLLKEMDAEIREEMVRVRIVGKREDFDTDIQEQMIELEEKSAEYATSEAGITIWIALSYGGRAEILAAVNKAIENGQAVDESAFSSLLWSAGMPDPDIIVRTSGEQRLSGFMTWASVYSELYFIDTHWPALTKKDFDGILAEYGNRKRRRGK